MTNKIKIRWGILGSGMIAGKFADDLQLLKDAEIVAVGSRTATSAQSFAQKYHIPHIHSSYESLADDADVDVIYVATPHPMHAANVRLCLEAGKAVLNEKPFTLNADEAQKIIELARIKGLFLMEAMWTRFFPLMAKVRELLADDVLGQVYYMQANFGSKFEFDPTSRFFNKALGAGALLDLGVYPISFSSMLFGTPQDIQSMVTIGETEVDYQNALLFRFASGVMASMQSCLVADTSHVAEIVGEKGSIVIDKYFWMPSKMTVYLNGQDPVVYEETIWGHGYTYQVQEVMRCLRSGKLESTIMPLDETLNIMQTLDTIRAQWGLIYPSESS